ncbi:MAG: hypothetical protein IKQ75_08110 [Bacteroidales bacterium]|nr:hypothetical protein [Bacteroidales bacterium]MBR6161815.1 hypothetical protein [Bacteroidales bacterium]
MLKSDSMEKSPFHNLVLEARNFSNPTRNERRECRVGSATDARGCVSETRHYYEMSSSVHPARCQHTASLIPTLRSTPLRLCGVNKMACLRHACQIPLQTALIHHNNTFL